VVEQIQDREYKRRKVEGKISANLAPSIPQSPLQLNTPHVKRKFCSIFFFFTTKFQISSKKLKVSTFNTRISSSAELPIPLRTSQNTENKPTIAPVNPQLLSHYGYLPNSYFSNPSSQNKSLYDISQPQRVRNILTSLLTTLSC